MKKTYSGPAVCENDLCENKGKTIKVTKDYEKGLVVDCPNCGAPMHCSDYNYQELRGLRFA